MIPISAVGVAMAGIAPHGTASTDQAGLAGAG